MYKIIYNHLKSLWIIQLELIKYIRLFGANRFIKNWFCIHLRILDDLPCLWLTILVFPPSLLNYQKNHWESRNIDANFKCNLWTISIKVLTRNQHRTIIALSLLPEFKMYSTLFMFRKNNNLKIIRVYTKDFWLQLVIYSMKSYFKETLRFHPTKLSWTSEILYLASTFTQAWLSMGHVSKWEVKVV